MRRGAYAAIAALLCTPSKPDPEEERIQRVMEALRSRFLATSYDHTVHWRDMAIAAIEAVDPKTP